MHTAFTVPRSILGLDIGLIAHAYAASSFIRINCAQLLLQFFCAVLSFLNTGYITPSYQAVDNATGRENRVQGQRQPYGGCPGTETGMEY